MITPRINNTAVTFGPCRLCYVNLFEKKKFDGDPGDGKYMTNILIPKTETETVKAIQAAIETAKQAMMPKWGGKVPKNYRNPMVDGDDKEDQTFAGHWVLNAKSNYRPTVVARDKQPITDPEEMYSGVWAICSVSFFGYNKGGNGVGVSLQGVMKFKDDDRIGGSGNSAAAVFASIDIDEDEDL